MKSQHRRYAIYLGAKGEPTARNRNLRDWLDASLSLAHTTSMRPSVEEAIDADPAADLAAEEENKLINEVDIGYPRVKLAAC